MVDLTNMNRLPSVEKYQMSEATGMIMVLHELMNKLQTRSKNPVYTFTPLNQ